MPAFTPLSLRLLGAVQIEQDGKPIYKVGSQKSLALIGYLVRQPQAVSRIRLATLFWSDQAESEARANLRWAINNLSKLLPGCLATTRDTVQFQPLPHLSLDVFQFETFTKQGDNDSLRQAVDLYRGEWLEGLTLEGAPELELWLVQERELWQRRVIEALTTLIDQEIVAGNFYQSQRLLDRLLSLEPWREEAHRQLMWILARSGQRSLALAHYEATCRILSEELAAEPMPETVQLYEQIRDGKIDRETRRQGEEEIAQDAISSSPPLLVSLSPPLVSLSAHQDWGEIPDSHAFYGRQEELVRLRQWVVADRCRLVAVLGMGGIGKTTLTARLARQVAEQFEFVIWRSLLNAPALADILRTWVQFLSGQQLAHWPETLDAQLTLLFDQLRLHRCLLVLDNAEALMQGADRTGYYRSGYEAYGQLFKRIGESSHQSCLLLTTREQPQEVTRLAGDTHLVRNLALTGLAVQSGVDLLSARGLAGHKKSIGTLVERYSGNPLALNLVAETILDFFAGDMDAFLSEEALIFDDIRAVLDQHFARLSPLERSILLWLALERQECTLQTLHNNLWPPPAKRDLLEALRSLQQRSLLEKTSEGLALQNVVMEYATSYLIDQFYWEICTVQPTLLKSHAWLKAQAKESVRQSLQRFLLKPLGDRLLAELGNAGLQARLKGILALLRTTPSPGLDYAGGNILSLLLHLGFAVCDYDFSHLSIRQVYLQGARLADVNFTHSHWSEPIFTNTFGNVTTIAFQPDGKHLAAGSSDGSIHLWRVSDGQLTMTLLGHQRFVWSLAFSPDNRWLVSGSADQTVRVWDLHNEQLRYTLSDHGDVVYTVAIHPKGNLFASSGDSSLIHLHDLHSGQLLRTLTGPTTRVYALAFHPAGKLLVCAGHDGGIHLWDVATGQLLQTLLAHSAPIWRLAFAPDGSWLASSSYDHSVRIWDFATDADQKSLATTPRQSLQAHALEVGGMALSPHGDWLASGSWDKTIRLWDVQRGQTLQTLYGHSDWISEVAFSPDGSLLASGSWDKSVRLWEVSNPRRDGRVFDRGVMVGGAFGTPRHTFLGFVSSIYIVAFSPDGALLASGGEDQQVRLWEMQTGETGHKRVRTLEGHSAPIYAIAFHPQGMLLASAGNDQTIRLWDHHTGKLSHLLQGHSNSIKSLAFSPRPHDNLLVSASKDQTLRLWNSETGRTLQVFHGHTNTVAAVAFHPNGTLIASGSYDQTIRLWDVTSAETIRCLSGHTGWVYAVAFSPDGKILASASYDKTIRLWDVQSGELRNTLHGHSDYVYAVAFSPDGATLASSSTDQTVCLWDAQSGAQRHCLTGHTNWVWSLAFSPHDGLLASGSVDETIRLWDGSTGVCHSTLRTAGPYTGMNITGAKGLTAAQKAALKRLGALEEG